MRTIGIITNLNPITIKVYDTSISKVVDIIPDNYDETFPFQILSPVEYHKDTNSINILPDTILTEQEKNNLMQVLKKVAFWVPILRSPLMSEPEVLSSKPISSHHK